MQAELAQHLRSAGDVPLNERFTLAAEAAGANLLFVLPAPDGAGLRALVHRSEAGEDHFIQIRTADTGFEIDPEPQIDTGLLDLARASVDVFRRILADDRIRRPLMAS